MGSQSDENRIRRRIKPAISRTYLAFNTCISTNKGVANVQLNQREAPCAARSIRSALYDILELDVLDDNLRHSILRLV